MHAERAIGLYIFYVKFKFAICIQAYISVVVSQIITKFGDCAS